ncbi:MAG: hypothetical protein DRI69_09445 [Bacteroidetes bacterium]|nr:MAG: hypothetical protein DRI69_09445 [Bacteroidota bacterium]
MVTCSTRLATSPARGVEVWDTPLHLMSWMSTCLILLGLLCAYSTSEAQGNLDMELWSVDHGLSNRVIKFATRDPDGFLWLVSSDIEKYDGHKITRFTKFDTTHHVPVSNVNTAIQLSDSILLVSEKKDLFAFNMMTGQTQEHSYPENMSQGFNVLIRMIQKQDQPDILLVTSSDESTSFHLVDTSWSHLLEYQIPNGTPMASTMLRSYANGPSGVLWLMNMTENQILRISSTGTQTISYPFASYVSGLIYRIVFHRDHGLLIVRSDGVIDRISDSGAGPERVMEVDMQCEILSSVHFERNGRLFLTCQNMIASIDIETQMVDMYDEPPFDGLRPEIHHIFEDSESITWLCTEIGLLKIAESRNSFQKVLQAGPDKQNIQFREIIPWADSSTFICRITQATRSMVKLKFDDRHGVDTTVLFNDIPGTGLFLKYQDLLYHVKSGTPQLSIYNVKDQSISRRELPLAAASGYYNQYFIDGSGHLFYVDANRNITIVTLSDFSFRTIELSHKHLLSGGDNRVFQQGKDRSFVFGTGRNGLVIFDSTGSLIAHYSENSDPALSSNFVNSIVQDSGDIFWIGTLGGGLNRVDRNTGVIDIFTVNNGLPNNLIASMTEDLDGNLWIGTYRGLSRLDKSNMRFNSYFVNDGLPHNEFNYLASHRADGGMLYIGTFNGLIRFDPRKIVGQSALLKVMLTSVQTYNRKTNTLSTKEFDLKNLDKIVLTPFDNYVQLEFAVPSYIGSGSYRYRTKLQGIDQDWQDLGRNHFIRLRQLAPGNYQLLVSASDVNGNESAESLKINLVVKQIFYKSWWFISCIVIIMFSTVYLLYQYRLNLLRKEEQTRSRISSDLHDEIGTSLTRISLQTQLLELQLTGKHKEAISRIGDVVDNSIVRLRDLVWSVDMSSDRWEAVLARMEAYAYETLRPRDIVFEFNVHGINSDKLLKPLDKRNIYLIFKEAINNVSKHSTGDTASAVINNDHHSFTMIIRNSTSSQSENSKADGNGLSNLVMRAERLGGSLTHGYVDREFEIKLMLSRSL